MRSLCSSLSLVLLLALLTPMGWTQCPGGSCPQNGSINCWVPGPYPRYPGYGMSSSNYYTQASPPFLAGGPAYGYTYPYPWSAICAPPRNYVAPAYPAYYYYPYYGQSASHYNGYPPSYHGTLFATERSSTYPPPSPTNAAPAKPAPSAPAVKTSTSAKPPTTPPPTTLPDSVPPKTDPSTTAASDTSRKPLWRRLLFLP